MTFCGGQRDALTTARLKETTNATRARPQQTAGYTASRPPNRRCHHDLRFTTAAADVRESQAWPSRSVVAEFKHITLTKHFENLRISATITEARKPR